MPMINNVTQSDLYTIVKESQAQEQEIMNKIIRCRAAQQFGAEDQQEEQLVRDYVVDDWKLYYKSPDGNKLVVPNTIISRVLHFHHDTPGSAHPGYEETLRQIQRRYYFKGMRKTVQDYVKNCLICAAIKPHRLQPRAPMKPHSPQAPFEMLSIDVLGPYKETSRHNQYIIMVEDVFTKWVEAIAVPLADIKTIVQYLESEIFSRYGYPKVLISDNAKVFQGDRYLRMCRTHGITAYYSPIYHQRSNPVERRVQEFKKVMRSMLYSQRRRRNWDQHLPKTLHVLRGRTNQATGMSPSEAVLGYKLPREGEWEIPEYVEERNRQTTRQARLEFIRRRQLQFQQQWYQQNRRPQVIFRPGQFVMTREGAPNKGEFGNAWSGPHVILTRLSDEVYEVEKNGSVARTHVDDIRPAPQGNPPPEEVNVGDPEGPGDQREEAEPPPTEQPSAREDHDDDDERVERGPEPGNEIPDPDDIFNPGPSRKPDHGEPPPTREISGPTLFRRGRRVRLVARD